jgi:CIC family chloride channel protein
VTDGARGRRRARRGERTSERIRVPPPLIKRRISSGRGAMEQPNVTGDGDAALTPIFWVMVVLTGVATGLFGDFADADPLRSAASRFDYHAGDLQTAVEHVSDLRRVLSLCIAGECSAELPGTCFGAI